MILTVPKPSPLVRNCYVKKLKLNKVVYHEKVFSSSINPFLKEKIWNAFIVDILTLKGKN